MNSDNANRIKRELKKVESTSNFNLNQLRSLLALERVVARLVSSDRLSNQLVFKGGLVMAKVYDSARYTRDIDALGNNISYEELRTLVPPALQSDLDDGLWFGDVTTENLEHQGEYHGLRFDIAFQIGNEKINKVHKFPRVHFDIGIGDAIPSDLTKQPLTQLVQVGEPISWKVYPAEYIYSEKIETLVKRGSTNSRAKDFHDLRLLFPKTNREQLKQAIFSTFERRKTAIPKSLSEFVTGLDLRFIQASWDKEYGSLQETIAALVSDFAEIDSMILGSI